MRVRALIHGTGKNAAGVVIPEEVVDRLGAGRRPPVKVTLGDYTFRTSIASVGGSFMLGINTETRARTGVAVGDEVDLEIEVDLEPREVTVPADLGAALEGDPAAKEAFQKLSYSNKRRVVMPIEAIQGAGARQSRIERTVANLRSGKF